MNATSTQHISVTPGVCGGKPCVSGTRIRVQDIYVWHELQQQSPEEIIRDLPQLTLADVYAALAHFWDHRDEIQADMARADQLVAELKASIGAGPLVQKLVGTSPKRDPVPSR